MSKLSIFEGQEKDMDKDEGDDDGQ